MPSHATSHSSNHSQPLQNPLSNLRSNPHFNTTTTLPLSNTHIIPTNSSIIKYQTMSSSTLPLSTVPNRTYINSSASISGPIKS